MPSTLLAFGYGLMARALPVLFALQDPPHTGAAHPAAAGGGAASGGGGAFGGMNVMLLLMLPAMLLFIVMSGRKQKKEAETLQKGLVKGDKVVTTSMMVGTISGIDDQFVVLEISEKVKVKFLRDAIARKLDVPVTATTATADAKK